MIHPQALVKLFSYNAEIINKQVSDISHEKSLLQLPFDGNGLNWVLGHIVSSRTWVFNKLNLIPVMNETMRIPYRNGSENITSNERGVMQFSELISLFNKSQISLINGLSQTTYENMCIPSEYRKNTVGDSIGYFHFHETHHIGQIMYLAQFVGKKGVWLD